ncbi:hypothetical protein, variant [Aphanomyces invadans]|uniref:Rap-GAP domain-containing protein n=1 Tax=Aphanomyces invadans TaxID=157072 RepID=A0A024TUX6_9STRA|nr:hypothetical protein, variant [Aphanomyces invadans]ETV97152.1 hypothetical protein, variant [Aphanomyces invadans]|eukprot:XP_008874398.1 hypothetical protein, variant [Aphanomyces invadans]
MANAAYAKAMATIDSEVVSSIAELLSARCNTAYARGDKDTCKRYLKFMTILVNHHLDAAATTSACLATMCGLVNVKEDGVSTWAIMKHLLSGASRYQVLHGLLGLLEAPVPPFVARGAVFFVGMSSWGSQRVASLEVGWCTILRSLLPAVQSPHGMVIFEVVLSLQRLIKKYGDQMLIEWDLVFDYLHRLFPWMAVSPHVPNENGAASAAVGHVPDRLADELLDTLLLAEALHQPKLHSDQPASHRRFQGNMHDLYALVELYIEYCPVATVGNLVAFRAEGCTPASDSKWLTSLHDLLTTFFASTSVDVSIRLQALKVLDNVLKLCHHICDDRVLDDVFVPHLQLVHDDSDRQVRDAGLELIVTVACDVDSVKFYALVDMLHVAATTSKFVDAQHKAMNGLTTLFRAGFQHIPSTRCVRIFELLTGYVVTHRDPVMRGMAITCLRQVCSANASFHMLLSEDCREAADKASSDVTMASPFLMAARGSMAKASVATLPIPKLVVAALTMVSTETSSTNFHIAVDVLVRMVENRYVLHDVDVNDMVAKLVSCVECRAFGRAAATHEAGVAHSVRRTRTTDSHVIEDADSEPDKSAMWLKVLRTQYLQRGLDLLLLMASYQSQLTAAVQHRVLLTFVSALDFEPTVSESRPPTLAATSSAGMKRTKSAMEDLSAAHVEALQAAETKLVHTVTRGLGVAAIMLPAQVVAEFPTILNSIVHRLCAPVKDGAGWTSVDIASLCLSLLLHFLHALPRTASLADAATDGDFETVSGNDDVCAAFALRALCRPASKYMASLALLVLMQIFIQASARRRNHIARLVLPQLQTQPQKTVLVDTAVDFIATHLHLNAAALCPPSTQSLELVAKHRRIRSWFHRRSIMTLSTDDQGASFVTVRHAAVAHTWPLPRDANPMHVMTMLFGMDPLDLHSASMHRLVEGEALTRALAVLDRSPWHETHKVGVLYVPHNQATERDLLDVVGGSQRYLSFLRGLGDMVPLHHLVGYNGGLDVSASQSDGKFGLVYRDAITHVMFHVATFMETDESAEARRHGKKRHIGNDYVHIEYLDYDQHHDENDVIPSLSGQFSDVRIFVQPLDGDLFRTRVECKHPTDNMPPFGPLHGVQIVPSYMVATAVRLTAIHANLACRVVHQDRFELVLNIEDRLKQISQIGTRFVDHVTPSHDHASAV